MVASSKTNCLYYRRDDGRGFRGTQAVAMDGLGRGGAAQVDVEHGWHFSVRRCSRGAHLAPFRDAPRLRVRLVH